MTRCAAFRLSWRRWAHRVSSQRDAETRLETNSTAFARVVNGLLRLHDQRRAQACWACWRLRVQRAQSAKAWREVHRGELMGALRKARLKSLLVCQWRARGQRAAWAVWHSQFTVGACVGCGVRGVGCKTMCIVMMDSQSFIIINT